MDFSYMLYLDQVGLPVPLSKGRSGMAWVRTTTDLPAAMLAILSGDTDWKSYLRSIRNCNMEAVFSPKDPLPGLGRSGPHSVFGDQERLLKQSLMNLCSDDRCDLACRIGG